MKRLTKTGIEYGDYGWNFLPGCKHKAQGKCPVTNCWAEGMSKRQRFDFQEPHLIPELLLAPLSIKKPSTILVNFMGDLGGDWVEPTGMVNQKLEIKDTKYSGYTTDPDWSLNKVVFDVIKYSPKSRFLFLTKNPAAWIKWGEWPENAWVGATVCNQEMFIDASDALWKTNAKHKWISFEPLLEEMNGGECEGRRLDYLKKTGVSWLVIGAQSRPDIMPKIEWVREIVEAAYKAGVKVWLKDNLIPMFEAHDRCATPEWALDSKRYYRQEVSW